LQVPVVSVHVGRAEGHWLLMVHSTQAAAPKPKRPVRQYGVAAEQSLSIVQATQKCACEQTWAVAEVQSALTSHSTHVDVATLQ
jgi:hypothetical protein